jgi:hypothetical protein
MKKTDTGDNKSKGSLNESDVKAGFKKLGKIPIGNPRKSKNWGGPEHKLPGVDA